MARKLTEVRVDKHGNMSIDLQGFQGPECERVQKLIEELFGETKYEEKKREYHIRVSESERVRGG